MIDTTAEKPIPIDEIPAEHIPGRGGRPVHQVTLSMWYRRGVRGILLETIMIGGRRCTSIEALNRFYQAVSQARSTHPSHRPPADAAPSPRTGRDKSKAVSRAMAELAKRGAGKRGAGV